MVVAPMLLFIGNALHPVNHNRDEHEWLAGIAEHRPQWLVAHLFVFASLPLFVPAVLGLLHALRRGSSRVANAGVALAVWGAVGTAGFVAVEGLAAWQMTGAPEDRDAMAGLLERFNETAATFLPTGLATFVFSVALGLLGYALLRAGAKPRWPAAAIVASRIVSCAALVVGHAADEYPMAVIAVADLLLFIGFAGVVLRLSRRRSPQPA